MIIKEEIVKQKDCFIILCQNHKGTYLYDFGSATNNSFNPITINIDLLVYETD